MKLTTAAVIAFAAASCLALTTPYKETAVYAPDLYERGSGEGVLVSFEKRGKRKHKSKHGHGSKGKHGSSKSKHGHHGSKGKHGSSKSKPGQVHTGGFATYFTQGGNAGACGKVHSDNALIVAIDSARFNPGLCGKKVKITNASNHKSIVATIADECPGCSNQNSIDLSLGAFKKIANLDQGKVDINWVFA